MGSRMEKLPNGVTLFKCCGKSFKRYKDLLQHRTKGKVHKEFNQPELFDARKKPENQTVFKSGATSSGQLPRFDLIPRVTLDSLGERYTKGAINYGDFNYRKGFDDKAFILDRINHGINHIGALMSPRNKEEWDDDNIGAILWFGSFLAELRQANPMLLEEIRNERSERKDFSK
jgi:hypothetical protein